MMYEHETLQDELDRRDGIPDYYDTMYLDGYDVNQICRAFDKVQRRKFRKIRQEKMAKREQQVSVIGGRYSGFFWKNSIF